MIDEKKKVIVSACLAGVSCRYDSRSDTRSEILHWVRNGQAIPVCPEQLGGLSTPRAAAEQIGEKIVTQMGVDVTDEYFHGAEEALKVAQLAQVTEAFLKSKSPMCGCGSVYDGTFTKTLKEGDGIFTRLLKKNGIKVSAV